MKNSDLTEHLVLHLFVLFQDWSPVCLANSDLTEHLVLNLYVWILYDQEDDLRKDSQNFNKDKIYNPSCDLENFLQKHPYRQGMCC